MCSSDTVFSAISLDIVVLQVLIPAMKHVIDKSCVLGVESFVIGMPHR